MRNVMIGSKKRTLLFSLLQLFYWALAFITDGVYASFLKSLGYTEAFIGTTLTLTGLAGILFLPAMGYVCDRFSDFRLLTAVSFVLMGGILPVLLLVNRPWLVYLYAFLSGGFTKVVSGLLDSWITKMGDGAMDYGKIRSVGSVTYGIVAVLFGRLFEAAGYGIAGVLTVILFAAGIVCCLLLDNPGYRVKTEGPSLGETLRYLAGNRQYLLFLLCMVLMNVTTQSFFAFFAILVEDAGGTVGTLGTVYFVMTWIEFFVVRSHSRISGRLGERKTAGIGMIGNFFKSFLFSLAGTVPGVFASTLTQGISFALIVPAQPVYQAQIIDRRYLATGQLILQTCCTSIVPFLLSGVYGRVAEDLGSAAMIRIFSVFALLGGALFLLLSGERKEPAER